MLHTVERCKLTINAPNAHVSLNLKSLHDLSHIHCASAEVIISDSFDQDVIYDQKLGKRLSGNILSKDETKPVLKVLAEDKLDIQVMSDFEILRKQIQTVVPICNQ